MKVILFLGVLFFVPAYCYGQLKTFQWGEICIYTGTYDQKEYSYQQIRDTYNLCFGHVEMLDTECLARSPKDIESLSLTKLDQEFSLKLLVIENLKIIKSSYWEKIKADKVAYLRQLYDAMRTSIVSYKDRSVLRSLNYSRPCPYSDALVHGGEEMLETWKNMTEEHCRLRNGNPKKCYEDGYTSKFNSPEKLTHAQIEIMRFGWWNQCVLSSLPQEEPYDVLYPKFVALFKKVEHGDCHDD